jgi:hypothetical protein
MISDTDNESESNDDGDDSSISSYNECELLNDDTAI